MSERTYVFDNNESCGGGMASIISALCNKQGIDPAYILGMMNNQNGMNGGFGWFWIIILLIFGWGGFGGNGFGNNGGGLGYLGNLVNNDAGRELLMNAIQGNANAIGQLSTKLGCDYNSLNGAIQNLATQICQLGNTIGLGQRDIIQQIMNGNQSILSQLCDCCCNLRSDIANFKGDVALQMCQQTNSLTNAINFTNSSVERGFAAEAYERQSQTCTLQNDINSLKTFVSDKFAAQEMREMQRENQNLRDQLAQCNLRESQTAQNAYLLNHLQPTPVPAYPVGANYGLGWGGYYPYGYLNNGNGCCNNGGGCC